MKLRIEFEIPDDSLDHDELQQFKQAVCNNIGYYYMTTLSQRIHPQRIRVQDTVVLSEVQDEKDS